jgi:hypothetical protein
MLRPSRSEAHVQVRAAARVVPVRLGHEGRVEAVRERDALHQPLEADGVVAGEQGIVHVMQVHLELARPVLGQHRAGRQFLRARGIVDGHEQGGVLVELGHRVDLGLVLAPAGQRLARRLRIALGCAFAIDEVELEFHRHHRREAERGEPPEHALERVARVAEEGRAVVLVHRNLHLRDVLAEPRHRRQRPRQGQADAVGVALVEAEARGLHGAAEHVEREHRGRQHQAGAVHAFEFGRRDTLATRDPHEVGQQQVHVTHLRVLREPGAGRLEFRELRHGTPECLGFSDGCSVRPDRA